MAHSLLLGMALALFLCGTAGADTAPGTTPDVQTGDTPTQVVAVLGLPKGMMRQGNKLTYYYDRGTVEFVAGRALKSNLLSEAEAERRAEERRRLAEAQRRDAEKQQRILTEEGRNALRKQLDDKLFAKRPPLERLNFWQDFSKRYPYTDVAEWIAKTAAEAAAQQQPEPNQQELTALKARVAEIKQRLAQLEADYAASLANWKRNEIDAEKAKLTQELDTKQKRIHELEPSSSS